MVGDYYCFDWIGFYCWVGFDGLCDEELVVVWCDILSSCCCD